MKRSDAKVNSLGKARYLNGRTQGRSVPATVARKGLERVARLHGGKLTPERVLDDAKSPSSSLHGCFEWNDGKAAAEYRIIQARDLIRSVYVQVGNANEYAAWVSVKDEGKRVYMEFPRVMNDKQLKDSYLEEALEYIENFQERYKHIEELAPVMKGIQVVLKKHRKAA